MLYEVHAKANRSFSVTVCELIDAVLLARKLRLSGTWDLVFIKLH